MDFVSGHGVYEGSPLIQLSEGEANELVQAIDRVEDIYNWGLASAHLERLPFPSILERLRGGLLDS